MHVWYGYRAVDLLKHHLIIIIFHILRKSTNLWLRRANDVSERHWVFPKIIEQAPFYGLGQSPVPKSPHKHTDTQIYTDKFCILQSHNCSRAQFLTRSLAAHVRRNATHARDIRRAEHVTPHRTLYRAYQRYRNVFQANTNT